MEETSFQKDTDTDKHKTEVPATASVLQDDEIKMFRVEDIPGVTICDQGDTEMKILQCFNQEFNNFENKNDGVESKDENAPENVSTMLFTNDNETVIERKVRLGEMTPFGTVLQTNSCSSVGEFSISKYLQDEEKLRNQNISYNSKHKINNLIPHNRKRRKKIPLGTETVDYCFKNQEPLLSEKMAIDFNEPSGSEYYPSSDDLDSSNYVEKNIKKKNVRNRTRKISTNECSTDEYNSESDTSFSRSKKSKVLYKKVKDDGDEDEYEFRLQAYEKSCDTTEISFHEFEDSYFKIPLEVWSKLYNYQKVGVQWLFELHQQGVGGILGDEMGLGKTVQVISFLSGLYYSKLRNKYLPNVHGFGASLIVCPTTLMYQWVKEFHKWLPPARIAILHSSGSFSGMKQNLIRDIYRNRGVIITSYTGMMQFSEQLLRYTWHYAILDEGHKIRNPDAKVTLVVKQIKTPHRLILSGSPLQNNLEELWSLFDFIYPGKLGALPVFQSQFSVPITHGGYANASDVEVTVAYKCATVLKELIAPYLLRRAKLDVKSHINLPEKNEQVLFCRLTDIQRELYRAYIDSKEVNNILEGQAKIFVGLINLRKICNHPDLYTNGPKLFGNETEASLSEEEHYGYWKKAGKMIVLETLLRIWHKQNHKVLLFTQSRKMLHILESFLNAFNYSYLKMDGSTCISSRQPLIDKFNNESNYFVMLLTTKVGGVGINLTSASRVVIYDPDWNPATDTQARERAWRIGQTQNVTIYRFITVGTIEEKIYHRQIFKQFLTNKVLKDPKQRRFFKSNDLFELFTLKESNLKNSTETGAIFAGTGSEINLNNLIMKRKSRKEKLKERLIKKKLSVKFSKCKIEKMKQIAQRLSQKLTDKNNTRKEENSNDTESNISPSPAGFSITSNNVENESRCTSFEKDKELCKIDSAPNCLSDKIHSTVTANDFCNNDDACSKRASDKKYNSNEKRKDENNDEITSCEMTKLKHNNKKHKKSKSYFEGEYVSYLVSVKKSKFAKCDVEEQKNDIKTVEDEYVLKKLFSKAGICSALQHDTIMEGGPPDFALVEKEAEKVAQDAINELKRSQDFCFPAKTGIPNWTGKHGSQPKNNSNVLSSQSVLDKIKRRNGDVVSVKAETEVVKDLKKFIVSEGGTASTDRLIKTFERQLPASMTPLFKCLLNKICTFYRAPDKKGYWTLKAEFINPCD